MGMLSGVNHGEGLDSLMHREKIDKRNKEVVAAV